MQSYHLCTNSFESGEVRLRGWGKVASAQAEEQTRGVRGTKRPGVGRPGPGAMAQVAGGANLAPEGTHERLGDTHDAYLSKVRACN